MSSLVSLEARAGGKVVHSNDRQHHKLSLVLVEAAGVHVVSMVSNGELRKMP